MKNDLLFKTIHFLKATEFFSNLDNILLEKLATQFETLHIHAGTTLIKEGDPGDCLYLVISGNLRIVRNTATGPTDFGRISKGELIGELALLTDSPRAATLIATRDCILLKLSKRVFEDFVQEHPRETLKIVKSTILRILHTSKTSKNLTSIITLAPAGKTCRHFPKFVTEFVKELSCHGKTLHLNLNNISSYLDKVGLKIEDDFIENQNIIYWLNEQESLHKFIVYETNNHISEWSKLCVRQADKILLVGERNKDPTLSHFEIDLFADKFHKTVELVLINEPHVKLPSGTAKWLHSRDIDQHHQVKLDSPDTLKRLIRYITGNAFGLVLSGGGARGLSHIGVYKALLELGYPIDFIGGSSFGALVSCFFAFNYEPDKITQMFKEEIVNKRLDYTLPILSLTKGNVWAKGLKSACGADVHIEDLWKNFFCAATNLTTQKLHIYKRGLLWKAVRASVSLPAVAPPVTNSKHELLVDGGVLNNYPVDIMQAQLNGGKIIGSRMLIDAHLSGDIPDGILSGWQLFFEKINPYDKKIHKNLPRIADIVISSMILSSKQHTMNVLPLVNYPILLNLSQFRLLDFHAIDQLIEIGYNETIKQLSKLQI